MNTSHWSFPYTTSTTSDLTGERQRQRRTDRQTEADWVTETFSMQPTAVFSFFAAF